jgi:hypothetical protein
LWSEEQRRKKNAHEASNGIVEVDGERDLDVPDSASQK